MAVYKEPRGDQVFEDQTPGRQMSVCVDSLESPVDGPADTSFQLADRIACLEDDLASKTYEIEALREQARTELKHLTYTSKDEWRYRARASNL